MPTRRRKESAPEEVIETPEIQEETPMSDVVDDVVEPETDAPAKRGRKADPLNAAMKRFKDAKAELEKARQARPLAEAEAEFEAAQAELKTQLEA